MRNAGRLKAGYYPCPPAAINKLLTKLRPCVDGPMAILDPCAGEGAAIAQIAAGLDIPHQQVWAVELDRARGEKIRELMPEAHVLAPASFLATEIRGYCYSLVYCNPPFDDSLVAHRRVEELFLAEAMQLVTDGGLMVFVCPAYVAERPQFRKLLTGWFDEVTLLPWPEEVREYDELFVIARRSPELKERLWYRVVGSAPGHYRLPPAKGPGRFFTKVGYTDEELAELLEASPLVKHLKLTADHVLPAPPLALGVGHLALLLASGHLDGLVAPPGQAPHVVRGVAKKVQEVTDETREETKTQVVTTKILTERIKLTVRAVGIDGIIRTFE